MQHAFSNKTNPSLCHALPTLECLHKTWTALMSKDKYLSFHDTLNAGLSKVSTYYNKTSAVDAYTMTMSNVHHKFLISHRLQVWVSVGTGAGWNFATHALQNEPLYSLNSQELTKL